MSWNGAPAKGPQSTVTTYIGNAVSVPAGGWDTRGGFDTRLAAASDAASLTDLGCTYSAGVITVDAAGFFTVGLRVRAGTNGSTLLGARLLVNGSAAKEMVAPAWTTNATVEAEVTRHFDAGDQITMQIYNNSGGQLALSVGSVGTSFCVTRWS